MPKAEKRSNSRAGPSTARTTKPPSQKASSAKPTTYASFIPIPLCIPSPIPLPLSSSSAKPLKQTTHYLYAREYKGKARAGPFDPTSHDLPADRTVFVANIPVDMGERDLRAVMGKFGVIERLSWSGHRGEGELEKAVKGIEDDDDDEEDEDEDEDEESEDVDQNRDGQANHATDEQDGTSGPKFIGDVSLPRRQRKRLNKLPTSVPDITPLPPLDPRTTSSFDTGNALHISGQQCAHIVYLDSTPLQSILNPSIAHTPILLKPSSRLPTGLPYYLSLHSSLRPSLAAIRSFADTSMARFDQLSSLLLSARAKQQGAGALVDEDGFTVVVRSGKGGRTGGFGDGTWKGTTSVGVASRGFSQSAKGKGLEKGKGASELPDFYKFQKVERKKQELAELRNQFEKDKQKVAAMREARNKNKRFKPY